MKQFFALLVIVGCVATTLAAVAKPTCGGTTSSKNIQLLQPAIPPRECQYNINAYSDYVCQLRIDFSLTLAQPSLPAAGNNLTYAQCVNDYLLVNGMKLCGTETNQHIYVPFNRTAGVKSVAMKVVLAARMGGVSLPAAAWNMEITQLECPAGAGIRAADINLAPEGRAISNADGFLVAPPGCLQYFPQNTGAVTSFNYNNGQGVYTGQLNYAMCFRRTTSTSGLQVQSGFFRLSSVNATSGVFQMDNYCYSQLSTGGTSEDYLMIPQATVAGKNIRGTYFCGESLKGTTVRSYSPGPITVRFNSDGVTKANEAGFAFTYRLL